MNTEPAGIRDPTWPDVVLWFETIDAIVRGLGHALNNRALSLSATIESLDPKRPVGAQVSSALSRESERLTDQLRQLRALPCAADREPLPILIRDVIASATQLHRSHASLGDVPTYLEGSSETPPVLAPGDAANTLRAWPAKRWPYSSQRSSSAASISTFESLPIPNFPPADR